MKSMLTIKVGRHHLMFWYKPIFFKHWKITGEEIWQLVFFDVVLIHFYRGDE